MDLKMNQTYSDVILCVQVLYQNECMLKFQLSVQVDMDVRKCCKHYCRSGKRIPMSTFILKIPLFFRKPCSSKAKVQTECKSVDKFLDDKKIADKHSTLICRPSNYVQLCTKAAEKTDDDNSNELRKLFTNSSTQLNSGFYPSAKRGVLQSKYCSLPRGRAVPTTALVFMVVIKFVKKGYLRSCYLSLYLFLAHLILQLSCYILYV